MVQHQEGNHPKCWDKRGQVIECLPYRQFQIMLHGSRRLTLRNRKFLKPYTPLHATQPNHTPPTKPTTQPAQSTKPPVQTGEGQGGERAGGAPGVMPPAAMTLPVIPPPNNQQADQMQQPEEQEQVPEQEVNEVPTSPARANPFHTRTTTTPAIRRSSRAGRGTTTRYEN